MGPRDRGPLSLGGHGFYLIFYPVLAAGLLLLVRGRAPGRDPASLIDATIITIGIGMLSWVFLIGPYVRLSAVWILYYVAVGLAALHPSMGSLSEPSPVNPRLTRTRLALLAGASLMAPAMLVIQTVRDQPIDVGVIAGGSVVLFLLILARMGGLASEVAMQTERKRTMRTVLRATEQERVRLAADSTTGRCRS